MILNGCASYMFELKGIQGRTLFPIKYPWAVDNKGLIPFSEKGFILREQLLFAKNKVVPKVIKPFRNRSCVVSNVGRKLPCPSPCPFTIRGQPHEMFCLKTAFTLEGSIRDQSMRLFNRKEVLSDLKSTRYAIEIVLDFHQRVDYFACAFLPVPSSESLTSLIPIAKVEESLLTYLN
jgi:hypothetical protein